MDGAGLTVPGVAVAEELDGTRVTVGPVELILHGDGLTIPGDNDALNLGAADTPDACGPLETAGATDDLLKTAVVTAVNDL